MAKCLLAHILEEAELLTAATLGINCSAHLLVLACPPVAAGLETLRLVEVSCVIHPFLFYQHKFSV